MRATINWQVSIYAIALAIGSRSSVAPADPLDLSLGPPIKAQGGNGLDPGQAIVVIGSRIPRSNLKAISPVTIVTSDEFKLAGATNAEDFLNQLPQVNASQDEFVSAGATGAATVDLRGLGAARTLVLLNGHRLMPGDPRFPVPNLNNVPTFLVQRVEVLSGGAAAVYGSDAVAGVVNFVLDTKLDGLRIDGEIGGYQHDNRDTFAQGLLDRRLLPYPKGSIFDGWRRTVSAAFGRGFFDNRMHVTLYGGQRQIDGITQDQRDYSSCPITAKIVDQRPTGALECGGSIASYPGNFFDNLGNAYQVTPERTFAPGMSRFVYSPFNFYQRPDKRFTAGGFANVDLSSAIQAYAEVMVMKDRTVWQTGPSGDFTNTETINCDNPLLSEQQRGLICRTGNFVGETPILDGKGNLLGVHGSPTAFIGPVTGATYFRGGLLIALRNIDSGPIQDDLRHKSLRLLGGFKGDLGRGVSYDASYLSGNVTLDRQYYNNLSITRLGRALDVVSDPATGQPICRSLLIAREIGPSAPGADLHCAPWDVFAPGQVSAQATKYLSIPPSMRGSFSEQVGNVNVTVELGRWGLGSPWSDEESAINVGAEFRKDSVDFDPAEFSQTGDVAGFAEQLFPIHGSIATKEMFGEARIPLVTDKLVRRLAFEGGLRKSWYENPGSKFSSDAYKTAFDLTVVTGLRVRASQQRAIRAPNILELFAPVQPDSFNRDPCAGISPLATESECVQSGVTPAQYGHIAKVNASLFGYNAIMGGSADLQPEAATTKTLGAVIEPRFLRGFNATIDWWDIKLKHAVSKIGAQAIVDSCIASGDPMFCSRIHRDPNGSLWLGNGFVDDRQANLGSLKVRGIDASAYYSTSLGRLGSANIGFRGSYVLRWIVDHGGLSTPYDCAGLFGEPCGMQPRLKHSARATWDAPHGISLSFQWRHLGGVKLAALDPKFGMTDDVSPANTRLRPYDYLDVSTVFRLRRQLQLRLGINNLFDRQPPLVVSNAAGGGGPFNGDTYPGWYDPLGRYVFASVSVALNPQF